MKWSRSPLYAQDLQILINWAAGAQEYYPETWGEDVKSYLWHERSFKVQLCSKFAQVFGAFPPYSVERLREDTLDLLTLRDIDVRSDFSFLHTVEISRLNEWLRHEENEKLWQAFSILYSSADDTEKLSFFVDTIADCLAKRESENKVTPPMLSFWIAYRYPNQDIFFKPQSTTEFYQKYGQRPPKSRNVVERYLVFRQDAAYIRDDLEAMGLKDADMIDVQSFIWGQRYAW